MSNQTLINDLAQEVSTLNADQDLIIWSKKYLRAHHVRYSYELKLIDTLPLQNAKVLEIGCAPFHMTYLLKKKGLDIHGWDIMPERFDSFVKKNNLVVNKVNIELDEVDEFQSNFDLVIFNEVFEHLRINPIDTLKKIYKVMKPQGRLLLSTPNLNSLGNLVSFIKGNGFDNPYEQFDKLNKFGHMGHVREYTARQVELFLTNTGFSVERIIFPNYTDVIWRLSKKAVINFLYKILPSKRPFFQIIALKN